MKHWLSANKRSKQEKKKIYISVNMAYNTFNSSYKYWTKEDYSEMMRQIVCCGRRIRLNRTAVV